MSSFEEAMHYGYSREEYARDMEEGMKRLEELGCEFCRYCDLNSPTCEARFQDEVNYPTCPYFEEVK